MRSPGASDGRTAGRERRTLSSGARTRRTVPSHTVPLPGVLDFLSAIRIEFGYETASAFARGPGGWKLLDRDGPVRPWHAVLDPSALEGTPEAAEYPDVHALPGVGPRLARLGCASLASLPLPEGGRVLLDSARNVPRSSWIERSRPYLALLDVMSGPDWPTTGALRSHDEATALQRVFTACQEILAGDGDTIEALLHAVREAIRADELFLLVKEDTSWLVLSASGDRAPATIPSAPDSPDSADEAGALEESALRELALELQATSRALAGAFGREDRKPEIVVAGWADGPALAPLSMAMTARAVSTVHAALQARREAVASLVGEERTRIAFALHDGLTQSVTGAVLELEALQRLIERDPARAVASLDNSKREIRRALAELRAMLFDLSPHEQRERTERQPLTAYVEDVVKRWRLPARVAVEGDLARIPDRVLSVAYVVIREALANAAKHAASRNVTVRLTAGESDLVVVVGDGGPGFTGRDEEAAREAHHVGLDLLRRQVRDAGGRLRIESQPGKGTRLIARLPIHGVVS